jgi:hypothetical protein
MSTSRLIAGVAGALALGVAVPAFADGDGHHSEHGAVHDDLAARHQYEHYRGQTARQAYDQNEAAAHARLHAYGRGRGVGHYIWHRRADARGNAFDTYQQYQHQQEHADGRQDHSAYHQERMNRYWQYQW